MRPCNANAEEIRNLGIYDLDHLAFPSDGQSSFAGLLPITATNQDDGNHASVKKYEKICAVAWTEAGLKASLYCKSKCRQSPAEKQGIPCLGILVSLSAGEPRWV